MVHIVDILSSPKVVLILFIFFVVGYIMFIGFEGGFTKQFLHFGPGTTPEDTTKFMGITLDSWTKVGLLYVTGFFTALMTTYYNTVMQDNIHGYLWNRAIKTVPFSKFWTYFAVMLEPFLFEILQVIQFFTNLTLQLQFIIPQFIGSLCASLPFTLRMLGTKDFLED
uniref:Uncharacterized protein n=1 Tax=viral metagenome TaxID=1070528 RepID=A0A6C0KQS9_9ZZZZ